MDCLYEFGAYVEGRYFAQIKRHYESETAEAADPRQRRLWEDDPNDSPLF